MTWIGTTGHLPDGSLPCILSSKKLTTAPRFYQV